MTSVLIVTPHMAENSTGRAYVWWLLANRLNWRVAVVSVEGEKVWHPLAGTAFAKDCTILRGATRRNRRSEVADMADGFDLIISVKPLPASLGVAMHAAREAKRPLIVDIDDPDLEVRLHKGPLWRRLAWRARYFSFWLSVRTPKAVSRLGAVAVSNPVLQERYGGTLVPHAREDHGPGTPHTSDRPSVAFVGTARSHKGIDVLRAAVRLTQPDGVSLTVTAPAPDDRKDWESWVGEGNISEGEMLVAGSDIVALPSLSESFAEGQLPAKLVDAMMLGRVVLVSDIEPMTWAVGSGDLCVTPGDPRELATKLTALRDPKLRARYAEQLRDRALQQFSVTSLAPRLASLHTEAACLVNRCR